ncbi:hypothetical protein V2K77_02815 [Pseudomonas alliivorans]|nr:hypothetical protein [Pseudomonas alliivorans]MEE4712881.1 hypothetical protein [Pseudomonas alliivorans]MEE4725390.1 hypothetical protein [Pseudomonas alliivorans]MEE4765749.1 hypothetical protein [Pseudomonas alliivorans]MEE5069266.1 hypothetical protein [Pseudomonas alliivorans]
MENLYIKRLTLISDTDKSANQFEFSNRYNLITANDNSHGKSTLAKMIVWAFGCSPSLDHVWLGLNCKVLVEFEIGLKKHKVARFGNSMYLSLDGGEFVHYPKITGDYSKVIQGVFGFEVLLPNKENKNKLEVPPPSYFFLPFYVDQRRSWVKLWDSFESLQQYSAWQSVVIRFHTGYLTSQHFVYERKIAEKRMEKLPIAEEVKKIDSAIETIAQYAPQEYVDFAVDEEEFAQLTQEVEIELSELQQAQENNLRNMAELQVDRQYLESQLQLVYEASKELELDYKFSVERVDGDSISCPLCGTVHDNSLASRTSILTDKDEALRQGEAISDKLKKLYKNIEVVKVESEAISARIGEINNKYSAEVHSNTKPISMLSCIAAKSVEKIVSGSRAGKVVEIEALEVKERQLKKDQRSLVEKEQKTILDDSFTGLLGKYVIKLNAVGVNLSSVKSPLDYNKIFGGGAAEAARGGLAYYIALINHVYKHGSEVKAPFIIDTPNQQEQTHVNYDRIIKMLMDETPANAQIFLGAMNSDLLAGYKNKARVIELDENKVLDRGRFSGLVDIFAFMGDCEDVVSS